VIAGGIIVWRSVAVDVPPSIAAAPSRYSTSVGVRDSVLLADGTRVLLGPASELRVPTGFGATHRTVHLTGEAFFRVAHARAGVRAFVVQAGPAAIRDIGTAFTIHGDSAHEVRVVVTEGSVSMRRATVGGAADTGIVLRAGDVGLLSVDDSVVVRRGTATSDDLAWTRGRLVFREAPMSEVRADLKRWYGVDLVLADSSLASARYKAEFSGESADDVLHALSLALEATLERHGDTAILRSARRPGSPP
jgi:transmembrane sensor